MLRHIFFALMLSALSGNLFARQNPKTNIKGQILTSDGKEVPFVSVIIKNAKYGTLTDTKGQFLLRNIPVGNNVLQIRIVGYQTQKYHCRLRQK